MYDNFSEKYNLYAGVTSISFFFKAYFYFHLLIFMYAIGIYSTFTVTGVRNYLKEVVMGMIEVHAEVRDSQRLYKGLKGEYKLLTCLLHQ